MKKLIGLFDTEGKTKEEFADEVITLLQKKGAVEGAEKTEEVELLEPNAWTPEQEAQFTKDTERMNAEMQDPNSEYAKNFSKWWDEAEKNMPKNS